MADEASTNSSLDLVDTTASVVSAYVRRNATSPQEVMVLIEAVYKILAKLAEPQIRTKPNQPPPAVPIRRSVTQDYIISLEDGKHYKMLKRHLSKLGLTPSAYRAKWGLPPDYPMVAPKYSERRATLAKSYGLGHRSKKKRLQKFK